MPHPAWQVPPAPALGITTSAGARQGRWASAPRVGVERAGGRVWWHALRGGRWGTFARLRTISLPWERLLAIWQTTARRCARQLPLPPLPPSLQSYVVKAAWVVKDVSDGGGGVNCFIHSTGYG